MEVGGRGGELDGAELHGVGMRPRSAPLRSPPTLYQSRTPPPLGPSRIPIRSTAGSAGPARRLGHPRRTLAAVAADVAVPSAASTRDPSSTHNTF
jgi:hypothetical protein